MWQGPYSSSSESKTERSKPTSAAVPIGGGGEGDLARLAVAKAVGCCGPAALAAGAVVWDAPAAPIVVAVERVVRHTGGYWASCRRVALTTAFLPGTSSLEGG